MNVVITGELTANLLFYGFIALLLVGIFVIWMISKDPNNKFDPVDLITDPITNKASITRTSQMIGVLTATFVVIYQAITHQLSSELFTMYMFSLGASSGFSQWVNVRYKDKIDPEKE